MVEVFVREPGSTGVLIAMSLDIEKMKRIVQQAYEISIVREYGEDGIAALRSLLDNLGKLYGVINPETITGSLIVFHEVRGSTTRHLLDNSITFTNISYLAAYCDAQRNTGTIIVQIIDDNQFHAWKGTSIISKELSENAIVYSWSNGEEHLVVKSKSFELINPSTNQHASIFAMPSYRSLKDALEHYKWQSIRTSRCPIFSQAWEDGTASNRLFFRKKPEEQMRKSLQLYLQNVLRGAYVHPEVNVDESHPVDIQITWDLTNRVAIIEIKWVGNSLSDSGDFVEYRDARANEGARQLSDYLDAKHTWAPMSDVMGYLVVIDARRRKLSTSLKTIDETNGLWYKDKDLIFDPEFHKSRSDFAEPIRMFAEPKCSPS